MRAHFPTATKLSVLAVSVILGGTLAGCSSDDSADEVASRPDIPLQSLVVGAADAPTWYSLNSELMQKIQQDKKKFIDDKRRSSVELLPLLSGVRQYRKSTRRSSRTSGG